MPPKKIEHPGLENASVETEEIYSKVLKFAKSKKLPWSSAKARGIAFEQYTEAVFKANGFEPLKRVGPLTSQYLKGSNDFGADLIMLNELEEFDLWVGDDKYWESDPDGLFRVLVQCKFFTSGNVGDDDVLKTCGAMHYYRCAAAYIVSASGFTASAKKAAKASNMWIELIDGKKFLSKYIAKYERKLKAKKEEEEEDWGW